MYLVSKLAKRKLSSSWSIGKVASASDTDPAGRQVRTETDACDTSRHRPTSTDPCALQWVGGVFPSNHAYQGATHFFFNMCNSISLMSSLGKLMCRCRSTRCFYVKCNVVREPSRPVMLRSV